MSRAFTKEDAGDFDELPERHQSSSPNYVTPEGLAALRRRMEELQNRIASLPRESQQAKEARRDLHYYTGRVSSALLVEPQAASAAEARFGATVALRRKNGSLRRVKIVGQDEAESAEDKIAWDSALAMALMGGKAGDRVETEDEGPLTIAEILYEKAPK